MGKNKGRKNGALSNGVNTSTEGAKGKYTGSETRVDEGMLSEADPASASVKRGDGSGRYQFGSNESSQLQRNSNVFANNDNTSEKSNESLLSNDGFQPVLSPAERRQMRKQNSSVANSEVTLEKLELKSGANYYSSVLNKYKSSLSTMGINVSQLPVASEVALACKATIDELTDIIGEMDHIIKSAPSHVKKPVQFRTLEEVDGRMREANENLKRLKANRGKKADLTEEDYEYANKEHEVYISYLRDQRVLVDAYERMKAFQTTLSQYKKACLDVIEHKAREEKYMNSVDYKATNQLENSSSRKNEYVCDILRRMKVAKGLTFDPSLLTTTDVSIMATAYRFHPPYNYLRRIKEMFCVHTDKIDVNGTDVSTLRVVLHGEADDVAECAKFLRTIDFRASRKVRVDAEHIKKAFGGISGLSSLEESFNVLTFYYQGFLDVIGSRDGVNLAINLLDQKVAELTSGKGGGDSSTIKSGAAATIEEFEARRVKLQYDYLICKALTTRFRYIVRNVELEYGVSVHLSMSPADGNGTLSVNVDTTSIGNEGSPEDRINKAVSTLKDSISALVIREVTGTFNEEAMSSLFSDVILRSRFVSHEFCLLRYNGSPYVVGNNDIIRYAVERVNALARFVHMKPREQFVPMEKTVLLSDATLAGIEDWTGVTIMTRDSINGVVLAIYGEAYQQDECVKQITDVLKTHVEYALDLSPAHSAVLSDNKYRIIRDVEQKCQVKIFPNKETNQLVFHGQKEKVEDAISVMKAFTENFVCLDTTKIDDVKLDDCFYAWTRVPTKHIPAVIGKGGSTIRDIINESGLSNMFVNRSDGSDEIVCFEGKKASVKRALQILSHILEFDGVYQKDEPVEDSYVGKYSSSHSILRRNVPTRSHNSIGTSTSSSAYKGKPLVLDCRDEDDFPALSGR